MYVYYIHIYFLLDIHLKVTYTIRPRRTATHIESIMFMSVVDNGQKRYHMNMIDKSKNAIAMIINGCPFLNTINVFSVLSIL